MNMTSDIRGIYCDNLFTLMEKLLEDRLYSCGTVTVNMKPYLCSFRSRKIFENDTNLRYCRKELRISWPLCGGIKTGAPCQHAERSNHVASSSANGRG
ncbi:hypothetical protein DPMN_147037 [Dreissena polymorpha]|uniref:Uncharacterized protein n=1 Tax=Dreissena polymorpha TaxID=45954 RepID=A0A9D4F7M3_DREPO|nr:hypothetical protein DPMN_147037 [Dreissena polymorpha]